MALWRLLWHLVAAIEPLTGLQLVHVGALGPKG